jgi:transposase
MTRSVFADAALDYVPESDQQAIAITQSYAKDHRPDLKQAVLELMVSQDGGVPLVSKTWDGNASDSQIFQDRAQALLSTFEPSPTPRYLIADSKSTAKTMRFISSHWALSRGFQTPSSWSPR